MKNSFYYAAKSALLFSFILLFVASCSTDSDDHHDEEEPVGLRVKLNGTTVVEQDANQTITGTISLTAGASASFTVLFISEDGDEFTPEVDEHSITVVSGSTDFTVSNVNSDSAPFGFDLAASANATDNSTITITMNHEGAPEFVSQALPVTVSAN